MNKTELIGCVAEKSGLAKKDAEKAVNAVLDAVVETLKAGEKVQLVGFGNFEVRERAARTVSYTHLKRNCRIVLARCRRQRAN